MAYMVINVPVMGPRLTPSEAPDHWLAAVVGASVVALFAVFVVVETTLNRRAAGRLGWDRDEELAAGPPAAAAELPRIPRALQFERVPLSWVAVAGGLSLATIPVSIALGARFWVAWLAVLAPWIPLVALESKYKYARYGIFAGFGLVVILQVLHMIEHSVQIGQLLATSGDLSRSHGIFGSLDFELVHFVTDTTLWLTLGLLIVIFRGRNFWLWVAFVAASLHQIEHFYLFYLDKFQYTFYLSGGFAGIMGHHGLIGSPLDRPYLHFSYNFIVITPLLIALWDEARRRDRLHPQH